LVKPAWRKLLMLKNYLKTAFRTLIRQGGSSMINIAGLTMGITCSLVLFLLVRHLSSFDNFHSKRDRVFRVVNESQGNQGRNYSAGVPSVLPDAFQLDFPEAEEVTFLSYRSGSTIIIPQRTGEPKLYSEEAGTVFAQSNFFKIFDHAIVSGEKQNALDDPNKAIISKRWAMKFFGKEDALGEVVKVTDKEYKIAAIMEDPPNNTDFPFDLMLSYSTIKSKNEASGWNSIWSDEQCYFLLKNHDDLARIESKMPAFTAKYLGKEDPNKTQYTIQPLSELHYDDRYGTFSYNTTSKNILVALSVIAMILILTACINFINLATAEAIKRSKEVGIRKTLGSTRGQLIRQFLGETTIVALIATLASLAAAQLALTFLNPFLDLQLRLDFVHDPMLWLFLILVTATIALLSGLYPAFIVSGYNPVLALKNLISNKNSSGYNMRRALVVTQFIISQFFIFGTIILINQMEYFRNKDLGFKKDAIIIVPIPEQGELGVSGPSTKMRTLRDEVRRMPGVTEASLSRSPPSSGNVSMTTLNIEGKEDHFGTQVKPIDGQYVDLFGLHLIAGHNIADLDTAQGFLVNEKFCSTVGYTPDNAVGKIITMWGRHLPIVGVVNDFHTVSLREPIEATLLMNNISSYETLSIQVDLTQVQHVIDQLKPRWQATYSEYIFDYQFLDQQIAEFYESENRMSGLLGIFSSIAIFIGCLGLFGLATFLANQKTKEIGVRKVLGASVNSIVFLFSAEYVKLIFIGFIISAPLAWYIMNGFLEEFTYRIEIGPGIFLLGLISTLLIATLTVGYRSFRSATANPANSLRSE